MNRHLITTADERSWKFDRPVLFLGEWCRLYSRKPVWSGMDAAVSEPYGLGAGQKERDIVRIQTLSRQLLTELTDALNAFHNTGHGTRYWNIVLGRWLQRFTAVIFNRYFTLEQALNTYAISGTTILDIPGHSLATIDSDNFVWACNHDVWNHGLYANILGHLGSIKTELVSIPPDETGGNAGNYNSMATQPPSIKRFIRIAAQRILPSFRKQNDAIIINSYLPKNEEIKLQIRLGQCPQFWQSPQPLSVRPDPNLRQRLGVATANREGFERYVRQQLPEMIPTCYLEGYGALVQQTKSLSWPSEPRFIFTSNNFDTDEVFKAWTGSHAERGVPYFTGQHGNNYGTLLGSEDWPEVVTCDKFLTWGWTNGSPRNVPAFIFKTAGAPLRRGPSTGGLLLIELCIPHRIYPWDSCFEFGMYQDEQFQFVAALPEKIREELTVRLHSEYRRHDWSEEERWKDFNPLVQLEPGTAPIRSLIAQNRLILHSYDSTGVLETLSSNIPTMCFWHGGLDHLLPGAKPYYELLKNAGILFNSPEQAAQAVALRWEHVGEWWDNQVTQDARAAFCAQFARTEENPARTLKHLLTSQAFKVAKKQGG